MILSICLVGCEGPMGPAGQNGQNGDPGATGEAGAPGARGDAGVGGPTGPTGPTGCIGLAAGATPGIVADMTVSSPAGGFFAIGDAPSLHITLTDSCGQTASATTANLYLYGPREALETVSANALLNAVTDRNATDRQHHFLNLLAPSYADTAHPTVTANADGSFDVQLRPISDEAAGTYTAVLWAKGSVSPDDVMALADLQIGTATVENYITGPSSSSTCDSCHRAKSGTRYMHHIRTSAFAPAGNRALDSQSVPGCKACHNNDGYSPNAIIRKAHAVHRGSDQLEPGLAHPEYGAPADSSLADYTNVEFPSMPGGALACDSCHVDDRWKTKPSRLACGSCHDNVFYDTGHRYLGKPTAGACAIDADCAALGTGATCDTSRGATAGQCFILHPIQSDDTMCATCHPPDTGISPQVAVAVAHQILAETATRGITLKNATISGASGAGGVFLVGDKPVLTFQLSDRNGNVISDFATNNGLAGTIIVGGPNTDRQTLLNLSLKKSNVIDPTVGAISFDSASGTYTYSMAKTLPATSLPPFNTPAGTTGVTNPAGSYTLWLYIVETFKPNGVQVRDFTDAPMMFKYIADTGALQGRQVVTKAACNACHSDLQAHGGGRHDGEQCSNCHVLGASDRIAGGKGAACTTDAQCAGNAAGWESCVDTNTDGNPDTCVISTDPTPGQTIHFGPMIHAMHTARFLEGYRETNNLVNPGKLSIVGFNNGLNDFSEILLPIDPRQCTTCHADGGQSCSSSAACAVGQECSAGKCVNTAWLSPSAAACLSCHDSAAAAGHAALNTWGAVETCTVCHDRGAAYSPDKVHNVDNPFVAPGPRE
jgi:hypothetical protein